MSAYQLKSMKKAGQYISSHSYNHVWLDSVSHAIQAADIESSLRILSDLNCDLQSWSFCYPYGAHNESLISLLKANHCRLALTDSAGIANLDYENHCALSRQDTNDLPKHATAEPNEWTMRVIDAGQASVSAFQHLIPSQPSLFIHIGTVPLWMKSGRT
jgi:peptidoglycan/xylan/chitin deacetylase (PgdA/CDA1 family)